MRGETDVTSRETLDYMTGTGIVTFRLTPGDLDVLTAAARNQGMTANQLCRLWTLDRLGRSELQASRRGRLLLHRIADDVARLKVELDR